MTTLFCFLFLLLDPSAHAVKPTVAATVQTTLQTASGHIRQLAFDGDPETYFASVQNASRSDHFTILFDKPVALRSVVVTTGRPKGGDALDKGTLEVSADGKTFETLAPFTEGVARAKSEGHKVVAIRLKPTADLGHPLAVREFVLDSDPPVATFKYPVEFTVDVSDTPMMKEWAEKAARVCEGQYAMISDALPSEGFTPPRTVTLRLSNKYNGVAQCSGTHITGSARYFKDHPDDVGAMVHETVHVVQSYRGRDNPGWLVEGIADYIRFFKYEPGKLGPLNPRRVRYDGAYRQSATFLAYVTAKYDKDLVRKLNAALRAGRYRETIFKEATGKTVQELGEEWKASLKTDFFLEMGISVH